MSDAPSSHLPRDVKCARCGSSGPVRIVYELPDVELSEQAIGGSVQDDDGLTMRCEVCRHAGSRPRPSRRFAVWNNDATTQEIVDWMLDQS